MKYLPEEQNIKKFRPIPFYFITTRDAEELSFDSIYVSLQNLKEQGFGGIVLFNKPPHGFMADEYLGDKWFAMVKNFVRVASGLDLKIWINDGFNFPPGNAGGRITPDKYPHLKQKRLVLKDDSIFVEELNWGFPAFEEPQSAELFQQYVYETYLQEVGEHFGKTICGFFSDADNRRVSFRVFADDSPEKEYFPWSNNFAQSFEETYGYDINPYLVSILKKEPSTQARDYWEHAGHLYQEWFAANYKWCKEHGLEYTFHTSDTSPFTWGEAPRSSLYTEGRALDIESNCDYPGTDQELLELNGGKHMRKDEYWHPKVSWGGDDANICNPEYYKTYGDLRAKQAGSTAFLYKKKGAMCEMFAATNWGATPKQLREIATWQIMQGITFIVPHAYHHRLLGDTKYFAPPIFSSHGNLKYFAKELNDTLARNCYYASLGELRAPIAVLDITDDIWEGRTENRELFEVCEKLNRMPYGYVLADVKSIVANKNEFDVIINTGAQLEGKRAQVLEELGIPVIRANELNKLQELIDCNLYYEGDGSPHFMRRHLDEGMELVIIANIEDGKEIKGILHIAEHSYPILLQSGEMKFFTQSGEIVVEESLACEGQKFEVPDEVPVIWEQENLLPLEYWKNTSGQTIGKHFEEGSISFTYQVADTDVRELKLLVSSRHNEGIESILLDGHLIVACKKTQVFDDVYWMYELGSGTELGEHTITLNITSLLSEKDGIFLQGDFGVRLECEDAYTVLADPAQYSLLKYLPNEARVILHKRTKTLSMSKSWCEQGHPFYSGRVTYCLSLENILDYETGVISIPEVHNGCIVKLDGEIIGQRSFAPYVFGLDNICKKHTLEITVYNSMGNAMEFYQAPSGITAGVEMYMKKKGE